MNVDFDTVSQCIGDKTVPMRAVLHLGQVLCADGKAGVKPHHRVEVDPHHGHLPFGVLAKMCFGVIVLACYRPV